MTQQVFVVLDHGERKSTSIVRGVFKSKEKAEDKKEKINGPFKWVDIQADTLK
jgi:hypothetical protein